MTINKLSSIVSKITAHIHSSTEGMSLDDEESVLTDIQDTVETRLAEIEDEREANEEETA